MKENLIIVGTGNFAQVAYKYLLQENKYQIVSFAEEKEFIRNNFIFDLPNVPFEEIKNTQDISMLIAVGPNKVNSVRERLFLEARARGFKLITYISANALVFDESLIGDNTFIFPGVIIEPFARVGNNCVIWSGATISHHSVINDNCFVAPSAAISGGVTIGKNSFIGINATVRDHVKIGERCIIGAGAVMKKDCEDDGVYSATPTTLFNKNNFDTQV